VRIAAIAVLLAALATTARADDDALAEAMRLEAQLQYEPALVIIEREIARGAADHDRLVTLHLFAGKLAAGLDRTPVAIDHFARLLALDPKATFSDGTSPKITEPFDIARARTSPLQITAALKADAITIVPTSDPLGLVAGIAIKLADGRELREQQKRRIEIPAGARATEVTALDAFGNRVWSQPVTVHVTTKQPIVIKHGTPGWAIWAGATVAVLGGAGVCAWRFDVAHKEWREKLDAGTDFTDLQAIEQRGKRWALAANIGFGLAGATAIIATVVYIKTPRATPTVTASGDAVGLAIVGGF